MSDPSENSPGGPSEAVTPTSITSAASSSTSSDSASVASSSTSSNTDSSSSSNVISTSSPLSSASMAGSNSEASGGGNSSVASAAETTFITASDIVTTMTSSLIVFNSLATQPLPILSIEQTPSFSDSNTFTTSKSTSFPATPESSKTSITPSISSITKTGHRSPTPSTSSSSIVSSSSTISLSSSTNIPSSAASDSSPTALPTPTSDPPDASNSVGTSKSGFLSNKPAVIGTFTAVGIVVVAILALLFFLCLKRRGGRPTPVRSERSLGSRGIDHDEGLMGYRDSEPNTPSVPGFNHHNDMGALAAGGAGATESVSKGVRFTDATAENRSVDYGLLDDGRYSSEKNGEFGYTGGDGRQATSYSYPSVSSSPSLGSTGLPPRGLSDAYYLGAGGTGGASGSDYTIDPNSSSNSFFPAQSVTSHTSNATTPPATATATSADQWANRALAKSNASALGKEVFSPFQSFQQFENLQQQEPISPRQSSYYRDSQFGDYFSSGDDGAYSGIAIGYASQLSPAASPIPLPLPAQGEKDVDVNINEESDWRKFDGPKPGSPSALGREVFQGFGDRGNDRSSNSAYLFSQNRF